MNQYDYHESDQEDSLQWSIIKKPITQEKLSSEDNQELGSVLGSKCYSKCLELMINLLTAHKKLALYKNAGDLIKIEKGGMEIDGIEKDLTENIAKLSQKEAIIMLAWKEIQNTGREYCVKRGVSEEIMEEFWEKYIEKVLQGGRYKPESLLKSVIDIFKGSCRKDIKDIVV